MKLGGDHALPEAYAGGGLSPVGRAVVLALLAALAGALGTMMEPAILIMTLGLFNIGVVAFLLLRKDITWAFLFYLVCVIFFQKGYWIRLGAFPDLYPSRVAQILLTLFFLIQVLLGQRRAPKVSRIEITMITFMVIMCISIITSGQKPRWVLLMNGYISPFLVFYFARAVIYREAQIRIVLAFLVVLGLYFGVMGVFEHFHMYQFVWPRFIVDPTKGDGLARLGFRVRGIFLMPVVLGCVMTMGFFVAWHYLSRLKSIPARITQLALLAVTPSTIFFTETRSVYVGFLGALLVVAAKGRKLRPLALGMLLAGMVGVFLNWDNLSTEDRDKGGMGTMNTVHARVNLAYEAFDVFMASPFFGCGFKNFEEEAKKYRRPRDVPFFGLIDVGMTHGSYSHNVFLTILAEQGILGIVPYVLIIWFIFQASRRAYRVLPSEGLVSRELAVGIWAAMAAFFINALFMEMRQFEYINVLLFFLMGLLVGAQEHFADESASARGRNGRREIPWPEEVASRPGRMSTV